MNDNIDSKYWAKLKSRLMLKFPQLVADDFQHREGREESMLRNIEYKLRMSKDQMKKLLMSFNLPETIF